MIFNTFFCFSDDDDTNNGGRRRFVPLSSSSSLSGGKGSKVFVAVEVFHDGIMGVADAADNKAEMEGAEAVVGTRSGRCSSSSFKVASSNCSIVGFEMIVVESFVSSRVEVLSSLILTLNGTKAIFLVFCFKFELLKKKT